MEAPLLQASTYHKIVAIRVAILPRALHGCVDVILDNHWMIKLRTRIMKALGFHRPGVNPVMRIAFGCSLDIEPFCCVAWTCVRQLVRSLQDNRWIWQQWQIFVRHCDHKRTYGPFANFKKILATLAWILLEEDTVLIAQDLLIRNYD